MCYPERISVEGRRTQIVYLELITRIYDRGNAILLLHSPEPGEDVLLELFQRLSAPLLYVEHRGHIARFQMYLTQIEFGLLGS